MSELTITREFGTTEHSITINMFSFGSYTSLKVMVSYDDFSFLLDDALTNPFNLAKSYNFSVEPKRP